MHLREIELKCKELDSIKARLELKNAELQRLGIEAKKKKEDDQILKIMAKIRGEEYKGEYELKELEEVKEEIEASQDSSAKLEKEILEGLKKLTLDVPQGVPQIDSENKATLVFEGDPCNKAVQFIASILNSDIPMKLDNVLLHPDRAVVKNVQKPIEVVNALQVFLDNISRLGRVALKENDPDVEEAVKYLHESRYRDIWEAIGGKRTVSNQDLYSQLNLQTQKERKKIRNFFTNLEIALKNRFPFIRLQKGAYELNFFGTLVWKRYKDEYLKKEELMEEEKAPLEEPAKKDREEKPKKASLNNFLDNNKIRETIYGRKVK